MIETDPLVLERAARLGVLLLCLNWLAPFGLGIWLGSVYRRRAAQAGSVWLAFLPRFTWELFRNE
jgi:hypothetical protein